MPPQPTYLVTGGAGFIGSHLCDALVGEGYAVRDADGRYRLEIESPIAQGSDAAKRQTGANPIAGNDL